VLAEANKVLDEFARNRLKPPKAEPLPRKNGREVTVPCFECGKPAKVNYHVVPGGTHSVPLCESCYAKCSYFTEEDDYTEEDDCLLIKGAKLERPEHGEK
jgi:hypothetical protein